MSLSIRRKQSIQFYSIEYQSDGVTRTFFFFCIQLLNAIYWWHMIKDIHNRNLVESVHGAQNMAAWMPNYYYWKQFLTDWHHPNFTLISMGLISYSCSHVSGQLEPIHAKCLVWEFFITFFLNMVMKCLKSKKKKKWWRQYSLGLQNILGSNNTWAERNLHNSGRMSSRDQ